MQHRVASGCMIALALSLPVSTAVAQAMLSVLGLLWCYQTSGQAKRQALEVHPVLKILAVLWLYIVLRTGLNFEVSGAARLEYILKWNKLLLPWILITFRYAGCHVRAHAEKAFIAVMLLTAGVGMAKSIGWLPEWGKYADAAVFMNYLKTNYLMACAFFLLGARTIIATRLDLKNIVALGLFLLYIFFFSKGRTGYLAAGVFVLFLGVQLYPLVPRRQRLIGLILAGVSAVFLLHPESLFMGRWLQVWEGWSAVLEGDFSSSLGQRWYFIQHSWDLIQTAPIWGVGGAGFAAAFAEGADLNLLTTNPHNEYLNLAVSFGVGAFFLFGLFLLRTAQQSWYLAAWVSAFAVGCALNSWLMDFTEGTTFLLFLGLALPLGQKESVCSPISPFPLSSPLTTGQKP